jgi:dedicator of cytokinesis protein 6/7/8
MEKLSHIYEAKMDGNHTLHIIPDSRQVTADELQPGVCYLQITAVDPVMEDEDLGSRREIFLFFIYWYGSCTCV